MFQYNDASIRDKLRLLLSLVVGLMLVISGSILLVNSFFTNRAVVSQEIQALTEVTSLAIIPALIFDDKQDAQQTLNTLNAHQHIVYAAVFKPGQQQPFAFYQRDGAWQLADKKWDILADCQQQKFSFNNLKACKHLIFDNIDHGRILLVISLNDFYQRLMEMIGIAFLGLLIASWLIIVVLDKVSKKLTDPILGLLNVSEQISQSGNYEIRAIVSSKDEIGRLGSGFNEMLDKIKYWHDALNVQNEQLEERVANRTKDLTDTKNEALFLADKAQKASIAKSEFLSVMSHEIRTPLNAILGSAEFLKETELNSEQSEIVSIINHSGTSLLNQINDILDFSKIEAGKMEIDKSWFDFYQLLIAVLASHQYGCREKSILLQHEIDSDVPRYLFNDEQKIRQILINLMNNAMKFTRHGSITLIVKLIKENDVLMGLNILVQDTGIGISTEKQASLFQSFTQEDATTTRKYGGTGLGLAIVKKMVNLLGGEVSLRSIQRLGSEFGFQIPIDSTVGEVESISNGTPIKKICIALIGDGDCVVLAQQLIKLGYEVESLTWMQLKQIQESQSRVKKYSIMLFAEEYLDQFLNWQKQGLTDAEKLAVAYCVKEEKPSYSILVEGDDISENTEHLGNIPVLKVCEDGLRMVRQISSLIDSTTNQIDYDQMLRGQSVLIVEDNPVNLLMVKNSLKSSNLTLHIATNGLEAIKQFNSNELSLILMDCQMPVMDGFDATREIRLIEANSKQNDKNQHIPIIALTANVFKEDQEACFAAGMDDFLSKPFKKKRLLDVISIWLNKQCVEEEPKISVPDYPHPPEKVLDSAIIKVLLEMDEQGSKTFISEMSRTFFENAEELMQKIEQAFTKNSLIDIAKFSHQLKSSSLNVAAKGLSELFKQLENTAKLGDDQQSRKLWKDIVTEYFQVEKAYEHFLKS